jgi:hypothetical protein
MSSIKLKHSGGNSVSLNPPTSAPTSSDVAFKLPNADGSANQLLKTDGSGNLGWATDQRITMADQWRITSTFQVTSNTYITTNWERNDTAGYSKIGTGMSESSGVFSFPQTGIYLVGINLTGNADGGGFNYVACSIYTTLNNSSYTQSASTYESVDASNRHWSMSTKFLFDVTDVSNCKVKFFVGSSSSQKAYVYGGTNESLTVATFTRLGDT